MVDALLVPNAVFVEEKIFLSWFDPEGHFLVDQASHVSFCLAIITKELIDFNGLQILDSDFLGMDPSPDGDFLVDDFFSVG